MMIQQDKDFVAFKDKLLNVSADGVVMSDIISEKSTEIINIARLNCQMTELSNYLVTMDHSRYYASERKTSRDNRGYLLNHIVLLDRATDAPIGISTPEDRLSEVTVGDMGYCSALLYFAPIRLATGEKIGDHNPKQFNPNDMRVMSLMYWINRAMNQRRYYNHQIGDRYLGRGIHHPHEDEQLLMSSVRNFLDMVVLDSNPKVIVDNKRKMFGKEKYLMTLDIFQRGRRLFRMCV